MGFLCVENRDDLPLSYGQFDNLVFCCEYLNKNQSVQLERFPTVSKCQLKLDSFDDKILEIT